MRRVCGLGRLGCFSARGNLRAAERDLGLARSFSRFGKLRCIVVYYTLGFISPGHSLPFCPFGSILILFLFFYFVFGSLVTLFFCSCLAIVKLSAMIPILYC